MTRGSLVFWASHLATSLALVILGMLIGFALQWQTLQDPPVIAVSMPPDATRPDDRPCSTTSIDFDHIDQEMQQIVDYIEQALLVIAKSKDQRPGLPPPGRIVELRAQAEQFLRVVSQLERNLAGGVTSVGDSPSSGGTVATDRGGDAQPVSLSDTLRVDLRQELAKSQTIRLVLQTELSNAQRHIEALQAHQATLETDLRDAQQASCTTPVASPAQAADTPRSKQQAAALALELEQIRSRVSGLTQERERLSRAYEDCSYRVVRASRPVGAEALEEARRQIATLEGTRIELQAQLSDATETADSCVARLTSTDDRFAVLMEQIEMLETAIAKQAAD